MAIDVMLIFILCAVLMVVRIVESIPVMKTKIIMQNESNHKN